jgi:hypothetical protein
MEKPKAGGDGGKKTRVNVGVGIGVVVAAIVAVALIVLLASGGDDDSSTSGSGGEAEIVSVDSLREAVAGETPSVYWAGERQGTELELSRPEDGRTYVRYLTDGAKAGDPRADFLTVGTYAEEKPVAALRRQGREPGGVLGNAPGGATVYFDQSKPQSVYVAFPGVEAQIEVYDPNFKQALQLVNSGQIVPSD